MIVTSDSNTLTSAGSSLSFGIRASTAMVAVVSPVSHIFAADEVGYNENSYAVVQGSLEADKFKGFETDSFECSPLIAATFEGKFPTVGIPKFRFLV